MTHISPDSNTSHMRGVGDGLPKWRPAMASDAPAQTWAGVALKR